MFLNTSLPVTSWLRLWVWKWEGPDFACGFRWHMFCGVLSQVTLWFFRAGVAEVWSSSGLDKGLTSLSPASGSISHIPRLSARTKIMGKCSIAQCFHIKRWGKLVLRNPTSHVDWDSSWHFSFPYPWKYTGASLGPIEEPSVCPQTCHQSIGLPFFPKTLWDYKTDKNEDFFFFMPKVHVVGTYWSMLKSCP